jgi:hypothetical protein
VDPANSRLASPALNLDRVAGGGPLRHLKTMRVIASEYNAITVIPLPMELFSVVGKRA